MDLATAYKQRLGTLRVAAASLRTYLIGELEGQGVASRIDMVTSRAKDPASFLAKAQRYDSPLEDIQDQIGVRVVVYYLSDVDAVRETVKRYFHAIEDRKAGVTGANVFGYEAWHCILQVPPHIKHESSTPIDFFELQVATLFQHAWAQAAHDLTYKSPRALPEELQRDSAWAAAQAYGADKVFQRLVESCKELSQMGKKPRET